MLNKDFENITSLKKLGLNIDNIKKAVNEGLPLDQIIKGINVEFEHTDNPNEALKIAMDHLRELPNYYDQLERIEGKISENNKLIFKAQLNALIDLVKKIKAALEIFIDKEPSKKVIKDLIAAVDKIDQIINNDSYKNVKYKHLFDRNKSEIMKNSKLRSILELIGYIQSNKKVIKYATNETKSQFVVYGQAQDNIKDLLDKYQELSKAKNAK